MYLVAFVELSLLSLWAVDSATTNQDRPADADRDTGLSHGLALLRHMPVTITRFGAHQSFLTNGGLWDAAIGAWRDAQHPVRPAAWDAPTFPEGY